MEALSKEFVRTLENLFDIKFFPDSIKSKNVEILRMHASIILQLVVGIYIVLLTQWFDYEQKLIFAAPCRYSRRFRVFG